jgi:hypothetical protein
VVDSNDTIVLTNVTSNVPNQGIERYGDIQFTGSDWNNVNKIEISASGATNIAVDNLLFNPPIVPNNAPTDISLSATSIAESASNGSTVGTLSASDVDAGETFTYSLVVGTGSTDNASFSISGNTLRTATALDFETKI